MVKVDRLLELNWDLYHLGEHLGRRVRSEDRGDDYMDAWTVYTEAWRAQLRDWKGARPDLGHALKNYLPNDLKDFNIPAVESKARKDDE